MKKKLELNKNSDKAPMRSKKRMLTVDYFHRTPSVYKKSQYTNNIMKEYNHKLKLSKSSESFYTNPFSEVIRIDILEKPKKPLARRKSCHCSECGKMTSIEKKIMALNTITHMRMVEIENKKTPSTFELPLGGKNRGRTGTTDSKSSISLCFPSQ